MSLEKGAPGMPVFAETTTTSAAPENSGPIAPMKAENSGLFSDSVVSTPPRGKTEKRIPNKEDRTEGGATLGRTESLRKQEGAQDQYQ